MRLWEHTDHAEYLGYDHEYIDPVAEGLLSHGCNNK